MKQAGDLKECVDFGNFWDKEAFHKNHFILLK